MADQIRTFIAAELDQAQRHALGDLQAELKGQPAGQYVRWVAPDSIHLTLKFLGGVEPGMVAALDRAVAEACQGMAPFRLTIGGLGAFPNTRRPNVVWVGLGGDLAAAERLTENIEAACEALGFAREGRPFAAHLTLGRVKRDARPEDRQFVGEMISKASVGELGEIHVESVNIMKSDLTPRGSIYTRLGTLALVGKQKPE